MPKPKSKKTAFIDKKNSVTFQLVHRSQKDALAADEDAPQRLLMPVARSSEEEAKRKEEERNFGVFFDDEYDYLKHLKDRKVVEHDWDEADKFIINSESRKLAAAENEKPSAKPMLPAAVFASTLEEEEVGLLNKAAPRGLDLSLDPDIVATLDEDFDFDDPDLEMEDDFIQTLCQEGMIMEEGGDEQDFSGSDFDSDFGGAPSDDEDDDDEVPSLKSFTGEETGTKFTNYSMSSSIIRRNAGLSNLDDQFEKFMDHYGEGEEGAMEGEEIEGTLEESGERMEQLIAEARAKKLLERQQIDFAKQLARKVELEDSDDNDEGFETVLVEPEEKWDCESILTTYSTLYNHPKVISERSNKPVPIKISEKTGVPKDVLGRGLTASALKKLDMMTGVALEDDLATVRSHISTLSVRNKHETNEEKATRKAAVKEYRRERRIEKKANTQAFKSEKNLQEKNMLNNIKNVQGKKIV